MDNECIAIITGGDSSEREVGLKTAASVVASYQRLGIDHQVFDVADFREVLRLNLSGFSRVFIALHGGFGENGILQGYLDGLKIPYNGPSPQASAICMDKLLTKYVAHGLGIHVPQFLFYPKDSDISFEDARKRFGDRFIVKPNAEGCSIGVSLIKGNFGEFADAVKRASAFGRGVLIEEFIEGQELSVCYFYGQMLPSMALTYTDAIFSWGAKYESEDTKKEFVALKPAVQQSVNRDGVAIAKALGLDYYRNDVIICDGVPYLIEINTLPGLTTHSLFPRACAKSNVGFDDMVEMLTATNRRDRSAFELPEIRAL